MHRRLEKAAGNRNSPGPVVTVPVVDSAEGGPNIAFPTRHKSYVDLFWSTEYELQFVVIGFLENLALNPERSFSTHSWGSGSSGDCPGYLAIFPGNPDSFLQFAGWLSVRRSKWMNLEFRPKALPRLASPPRVVGTSAPLLLRSRPTDIRSVPKKLPQRSKRCACCRLGKGGCGPVHN